MSTKRWIVVRYTKTGGFGIRRGQEHGMLGGNLLVLPTYDEAFAEAQARNGKARLSDDEFEQRAGHVPMRPNTKDALRDILVRGITWAEAARRWSITESGILRAMRRMEELNTEVA